MKFVKLLVTLAALAGVTVNAATVALTPADSGTSGVSYNSLSFGTGAITATGYQWDDSSTPPNPATWAATTVRYDANGVGVAAIPSNAQVNGSTQEYILFDFGAGTTTVSSMSLYYNTTPTSNLYFTYSWLNTTVVAGSSTPGVPLTTYTTAPSSSSSANLTFNMASSGSGRYLLLGATDHAGSPTTVNYQVNSFTYTTVPDGASTLALMGAAIATLGFASRRRRA